MDTGVSLNGVAHVILTVADISKSVPFYRDLCEFFQLTSVLANNTQEGDGEGEGEEEKKNTYSLYYVGGRTAIGIVASSEEYQSDRFCQQRVGLHHLCWRLRSREDVVKFDRFAREQLIPRYGGKMIHGAEDGT